MRLAIRYDCQQSSSKEAQTIELVDATISGILLQSGMTTAAGACASRMTFQAGSGCSSAAHTHQNGQAVLISPPTGVHANSLSLTTGNPASAQQHARHKNFLTTHSVPLAAESMRKLPKPPLLLTAGAPARSALLRLPYVPATATGRTPSSSCGQMRINHGQSDQSQHQLHNTSTQWLTRVPVQKVY